VDFLERHQARFPFARLVEAAFPLTDYAAALRYAVDRGPFRVALVPTDPGGGPRRPA
jgi:hypothetical protein